MFHPVIAQQFAASRLASMIEAAEHHRIVVAVRPRQAADCGRTARLVARLSHPLTRPAARPACTAGAR